METLIDEGIVWKDIYFYQNDVLYDYRGMYQVSSDGQIRSIKTKNNKLLKGHQRSDGYVKVCLTKNGKKDSFYVHRLVAIMFIPNPENKEQVNHIDENKTNNCVENLNWMTSKENINWGTGIERANSKPYSEETKKHMSEIKKGNKNPMYGKCGILNNNSKKVICLTTNEIFDSICIASKKYNLTTGEISACCKHKRRYARRHPITNEPLVWRYYDEILKESVE